MEDGKDRDFDLEEAIKIYISPSSKGFACGLLNEPIEHNEKNYVAFTIAKGLIRLALLNPDLVFDEGLIGIEKELRDLDFKEFVERRKKKLH
tara:strand:+ start:180 stop:455 length:276 start_codon:yes stop_codon:yes gene_type:complete